MTSAAREVAFQASFYPMKCLKPMTSTFSRLVVSNRPSVPNRSFPLSPHYVTTRCASRHPATRLDLQSIDAKWQRRWAQSPQNHTSQEQQGKRKMFVLPMFPYPSGNLHMGHLRVYTISDVLARFNRMQGYNVLHPMAWDAFGLPAENAAIERGIDPAQWTKQNISKMKTQLQAMGGSFDWTREFETCDPKFYKHTQYLFLLLYNRGFAYQAESLVNYDPVDRTVLANEQVDANGFSWRSGAKVQSIKLKQWFLRITKFKESLLGDLDSLSQDKLWPERILSMQRNWLGKSVGANIKFKILRPGQGLEAEVVQIFTTRPDTLYGVQYLALSINHPLVRQFAPGEPALTAFIESASSLPAGSKAGFLLPGFHAKNPLSLLQNSPEYTHHNMPVYVAPYVLDTYGEGAVMGVPGHDKRDYAFWKQNRDGEAIRKTVEPSGTMNENQCKAFKSENESGVFENPGVLSSACGKFAGYTSTDASKKIIKELSEIGDLASHAETWRLRDWLISRQRYWGTPIPIIHCTRCGTVPVPINELPVLLPKIEDNVFQGKSGNPIESVSDWVDTTCPKCGHAAKRETDTMDTFMDSSWYFMRFVDPHNVSQPFSPEAAKAYLPVDIYIGGVEHAILHLLYARFISKFLTSAHHWPSGGGKENKAEPFRKLISQGMVHGKTYSDPETGRFLKPEEVNLDDPLSPKIIRTGQKANISWEKMSKSKYNGVDPTNCITKYGADATRAHILFQAPVSEVLEWDEERIVGIQRWFGRVWRLTQEIQTSLEPIATKNNLAHLPPPSISTLTPSETLLWRQLQQCIISVTTSFSQTYTLNTIISDLMELTNTIQSQSHSPHASPLTNYHTLNSLLRMLAPIAPAFAEECWETLHLPHSPTNSIFTSPFPTPDSSLTTAHRPRHQTCVVQENGRRRLALEIPMPGDTDFLTGGGTASIDEQLQQWAVKCIADTEQGKTWLEMAREKRGGREWTKIVVVRGGKVVNFVG